MVVDSASFIVSILLAAQLCEFGAAIQGNEITEPSGRLAGC